MTETDDAPPDDPMAALRRRSGLDYLRAIATGDLPAAPIADLLGLRLDKVEHGRVVFSGLPDGRHYNPIGVVHGGYTATLLDSAMGCAVHAALEQGRGYTTVDLKVNYLRPLTEQTGRVFAEGHVVHLGGRVATAEARLTDESGKLFAHASSICLVFAL